MLLNDSVFKFSLLFNGQCNIIFDYCTCSFYMSKTLTATAEIRGAGSIKLLNNFLVIKYKRVPHGYFDTDLCSFNTCFIGKTILSGENYNTLFNRITAHRATNQ